jgi:HD-GYP domain-containing protein (c-di-GMP phosphodiesterase class II)
MERFNCNLEDLNQYQGYFVSQDVFDRNGRFLVKANYPLSSSIISALKSQDLENVLISDQKISKDTIAEESRHGRKIQSSRKKLKESFSSIRNQILSNKNMGRSPSVFLNQKALKSVEDAVDKILDSIMANPFVAMNIIPLDKSSDVMLRHSVNVCYLGLCLFANYRQVFDILRDKEKGLSRFEAKKNIHSPDDLVAFGLSCFFHDIGVISISDVIEKDVKFGPDHEAWDSIKQHPGIGYQMLFGKNISAHSLLGIKYHHENFDGSGYPFGVSGHKIHPYSSIIRIIDSFDAGMTTKPGREGKPFTDILSEILVFSNSYYDPDFAHLFIDMMLCGKSGLVDSH